MASRIQQSTDKILRRHRRRQRLQAAAILALVGLLALGEVARLRSSVPEADEKTDRAEKAPPAAKPPPATPAQLAQAHVNELGRFPILEYHDIKAGRGRMFRSPDAFRRDLARLYAENYRPLSLHDYLDNKIDVPLGMTPVILTFDDARDSQFQYLPDGSVDPDCALGILQEFARTHPDFPLKATFFVLTDWGFGRAKTSEKVVAQKFQALLELGCEVQNHTFSHAYFGRVSDEVVVKEIAKGKAAIQQLAPEAQCDVLALPGGELPRSKNSAMLISGAYKGTRYANRAVMLAWGGLAPAPASPKYNPYRLPRIEPIEDSDGLTHWLDYLNKNPARRYVSDGDPATVTVPQADATLADKSRLAAVTLRVY